MLDLPHLAESSFADDVLVIKGFLSDFRACSLGVLAFLCCLDDGLTGRLRHQSFMIDVIVGQLPKRHPFCLSSTIVAHFGIPAFLNFPILPCIVIIILPFDSVVMVDCLIRSDVTIRILLTSSLRVTFQGFPNLFVHHC